MISNSSRATPHRFFGVRTVRTCFLGGLVAMAGLGCRASLPSSPVLHGAEHARADVKEKRGDSLSPLVFADAEQSLAAAKAADAAGDALSAELHAEHALASYQRTLALARLSRAVEEEARAVAALSKATEAADRFMRERRTAEEEASELERRVKIAREAERPAPAGPADPGREKARFVAAESLVMQARLLCSAARLVSSDTTGLKEAEALVSTLEAQHSAGPAASAVDRAGRARAACLTALTTARRAHGQASDGTEGLFSELSRAFANRKDQARDLAPTRDERGVVLTLRGLFDGDKLSRAGENSLKDLGRIAAAHPGVGVQVVLHDAMPQKAEEKERPSVWSRAIRQALVEGGAADAKLALEHAGDRAPVFDPTDAKRRAQNARIEVVFVGF
jgi:outer membrane protein OmpA-like peptidoglycan-associated protein